MTPRKRTKIVATIGPATRDPAVLRQLIEAGLNVARLNFSHGSYDDHAENIGNIRAIARELGVHVAILQDLPGPKVRTGAFGDRESIVLVPGARFVLTTEQVTGDDGRVSVSYPGLARDVTPGNHIYLADGALSLIIESTTETEIVTTVDVGGELRGKQGINYPDGTLQIDAVTDRDLEHLQFGLDHNVDWVAVSFVRNVGDVARVKDAIAARGKTTPVIAKIEKHEALDNIDEIVALADGIMVARGDLGIEIPLEQVPLVQKDLIARANRAAKPVVTATQMLESMIVNARPTRAEAADVANAILDGTDAVMLSGETARGAYPVEAVRVMATIARQVERQYPHEALKERRLYHAIGDAATAIAESAARITERLEIALIVTGTTTGNTARHIASFRPRTRIVALTPLLDVARRLAIVWGVESIVVQPYRYIETLIEIAEQRVIDDGLAASGETIAITSGMPVGEGGTNVLKIHLLP
jgi:pyruvate kinase